MNDEETETDRTNKTTTTASKPWKKILYEIQGYPDNYTDKMFLFDLKRNIKPNNVKLKDAFINASLINQELCTVILFVTTYIYLYNEWLNPEVMFYLSNSVTAIGFIIYRTFLCKTSRRKKGQDVRTVLLFFIFGYLFSPVLHTLTDTISTNTIYTATFFMMLVHLIFFDYGVDGPIVSNSLSLSAAVFGSICLASRLASAFEAVVLLTVAVQMFALFPIFRRKVKPSFAVSLMMMVSCSVIVMGLSMGIGIILMNVFAWISAVCPIFYVKHQADKDNIYGPWDEAIVNDADNINNLMN